MRSIDKLPKGILLIQILLVLGGISFLVKVFSGPFAQLGPFFLVDFWARLYYLIFALFYGALIYGVFKNKEIARKGLIVLLVFQIVKSLLDYVSLFYNLVWTLPPTAELALSSMPSKFVMFQTWVFSFAISTTINAMLISYLVKNRGYFHR